MNSAEQILGLDPAVWGRFMPSLTAQFWLAGIVAYTAAIVWLIRLEGLTKANRTELEFVKDARARDRDVREKERDAIERRLKEAEAFGAIVQRLADEVKATGDRFADAVRVMGDKFGDELRHQGELHRLTSAAQAEQLAEIRAEQLQLRQALRLNGGPTPRRKTL